MERSGGTAQGVASAPLDLTERITRPRAGTDPKNKNTTESVFNNMCSKRRGGNAIFSQPPTVNRPAARYGSCAPPPRQLSRLLPAVVARRAQKTAVSAFYTCRSYIFYFARSAIVSGLQQPLESVLFRLGSMKSIAFITDAEGNLEWCAVRQRNLCFRASFLFLSGSCAACGCPPCCR